MFSRSSKTRKVVKPATVKVIKPEQEEKPVFDIKKAKITIIKPDSGLKVMVEEKGGED